MKLIVGLGNVGDRYATTRHNVGFMTVDGLAQRLEASWEPSHKLKGDIAKLSDPDVLLLKPSTMMNLSGESVRAAMDYYGIDLDDVWVLYDDADLTFAKLRVRKGGSSGGQNGVNSIIQHCGDGFWRFRIGISNQQREVMPTDRFVLAKFSDEEQTQLPTIIKAATDMVSEALQSDPEHISQQLGQ